MSPREIRRWAHTIVAMRATERAVEAVLEGDTEQARARLALADSSIDELAQRVERDRVAALTGTDRS